MHRASSATDEASRPTTRVRRPALFLLLLASGVSLPSLSGSLIFPFSLVPPAWDWPYRLALSAVFLVLSLASSRRDEYKAYGKAFFAFFIASSALSLQALSGLFRFPFAPVDSLALSMVSSTLLVVLPILALTAASGESISGMFLARGRLGLGLLVGSIGFAAFALVSIPAATIMFQGKDLTAARAAGWTAPLLVTVFSNGVREELLYRGLFMKKYETLLGFKSSNLLQAVVFSLSHTVAGVGTSSYTPFIAGLVVFTLLLGLVWGFVIQKTDSLLGSVLFHAGSDVAVFLGIFSNLQ